MSKSFGFEYLNLDTSLCDFFTHTFWIFKLNIPEYLNFLLTDFYGHFPRCILLNLTQLAEKMLIYSLFVSFLQNHLLLKHLQAEETRHINEIWIQGAIFIKYIILIYGWFGYFDSSIVLPVLKNILLNNPNVILSL